MYKYTLIKNDLISLYIINKNDRVVSENKRYMPTNIAVVIRIENKSDRK